MDPQKQLNLLRKIWGRTRRGYVFLPYIPASAARTKDRVKSWREGPAFHWPEDKDKVLAHLQAHTADDLYFSVQLFHGPKRVSEDVLVGSTLYADLDEIDPRTIPEELQPTYAWETSPGRYAATWAMKTLRQEVTEPGMENHKLTAFLKADPSGWDTTQVLRVPGSVNNKPSVIKAQGKPVRGSLLWADRLTHAWDKFDSLPAVDTSSQVSVTMISEEWLDSIDRHEVWGRIRLKLSHQAREFMRVRKDTGGLDRSEVLWQLERDLADAGCSLIEIVALVRPTIWNKYAGRADELKRLITEATKALTKKTQKPEALEPEEGDKPDIDTLRPWWEDTAYLTAPPPTWLVEDMIPQGGCGFIAGIPKSMKSWLALDLVLSMSEGLPWLDHAPLKPLNVVYIQQEDPKSLVLDRHKVIAHSRMPHRAPDGPLSPSKGMLYILAQTGFIGSDRGWQAWLDELIEKKHINLVVMDTLATVANGLDTDSSKDVKSKMLNPVKTIARTHDCAMLFVHHMRKTGQGDRAGQNMAGSGQIHAWADFGIYVTEKTTSNQVTFDAETKYTGTRRLTYHLEGLERDPQEWLPREVLSPSDASTDLSAAPIPPEASLSAQERIQRRKQSVYERLSPTERSELKKPGDHGGAAAMRFKGQVNREHIRELLTQGKTPREIRLSTGLSVRTIEGHMKSIREENTKSRRVL